MKEEFYASNHSDYNLAYTVSHRKLVQYVAFIKVNLAEKIVPINFLAILLLICNWQPFYCSVLPGQCLAYAIECATPSWADDQ